MRNLDLLKKLICLYVHVTNGCFYPIGGSEAPVTQEWNEP